MTVVPVIAVGMAYAWIAAGVHPFTWPMRVATAIPILLALVVGWLRPSGEGRQGASSTVGYRIGLSVWVGLLVLLVAWEVIAYFGSPRHDHPTLSSIAETVMSTQASRAAVFAVWLGVGAVLVGKPARVPT